MAITEGVDQPRTTYSNTALGQRVIADAVAIIDPSDTPLLAKFPPGSANSKFNIQAGGTKIEWNEDALKTMSGSLAATAASDATSLTVADASRFHEGDIVLVDAEYLYISARNVTDNTLTVTRNLGGTQATHASNATIAIISNARVEGDDTDYGPTTNVDQPYNYTQILQDAVKVTRSQQKRLQYGVDNELDRQRDKKLSELNRALEKGMLLTADLRSAGSATTPRIMGGLGAFITTAGNYTTTTTSISKANIDTVMLNCYQDGGNPRILLANPLCIQNLKDTIDSSSFVNVSQDETSIGMRVSKFVSQYGELELIADRHMDKQNAYILDPDYVGVYEYDPWSEKNLGYTGDYWARDIVGEFSLVVQHGLTAHGRIYTSSTAGL